MEGTTTEQLKELAALVRDPDRLNEALLPEEIAEYEAAQRSIVEARRSANWVEGRNYIC